MFPQRDVCIKFIYQMALLRTKERKTLISSLERQYISYPNHDELKILLKMVLTGESEWCLRLHR